MMEIQRGDYSKIARLAGRKRVHVRLVMLRQRKPGRELAQVIEAYYGCPLAEVLARDNGDTAQNTGSRG